MNKQKLISDIASHSNLPSVTVRKVLDSTDSVVRDAVKAGQDVFLFGLGKLVLKKRGPAKASNFGRTAPVIVPPRVIVLFQPSTGLKQAANAK